MIYRNFYEHMFNNSIAEAECLNASTSVGVIYFF